MSHNSLSETARPNKAWTIKKLEGYALDRAAEINNLSSPV